ncbi:MAG: 4a-hydroxytetrahydrobiopterin dehydratase [Dechloromonas sp.]|jgi:4a-hydroxytetrahydrobiopterin dehydratase|nr:4a-hydroxytetrahydrobiopterin dehydratase [Xanthomonadales bacterium]TXI72296.1 MAG: 4a-hydroxytetrahydrobiopterin dehydratase [Dechloromonas sp.]HRD73417.1 4a-hydroxytetrahydrobiopterin dehydratase [Aquimonas sp.]
MLTLAELQAARCRPLRGAEHQLSAAELDTAMTLLPEWSLVEDGHAILRTLRFADYFWTMAFVNALAFVAHAEDHHPDLSVHYDRVLIRYSTHDVGGLSRNDLICAAKVEALLRSTQD